MLKQRVLVVDDEESIRHVISRALIRQGCEVTTAASAEDALKLLYRTDPGVALFDIMLPGMNGLQLLSEVRIALPSCEVIMMTSNNSVDSAIKALRYGAFEYLHKPFGNIRDVWATVERAFACRQEKLEEVALLAEHRRVATSDTSG